MVRIRPARLSDASTIADIQVETWRDTYAGLIPDRTLLGLSRTSHIENWRGILRDTRGHNITRVAEGPDACIVGFANAGRARSTNLPGDGEVYTLYVLPDHQGAGNGRRLLGALLSTLIVKRCMRHRSKCGNSSLHTRAGLSRGTQCSGSGGVQ